MPQPKAHKYNQKQRLLHAKSWMEKYTGKKLHHGYAKHFGVSKLCAVVELEKIGVVFPPNLKDELKRSEEDKRKQREILKRKREKNTFVESDCNFAYIVGYTSGGAPYGVTWEEMGVLENMEYSDVLDEKENCDDNAEYEVDINDVQYYRENDLPF